MTFTEYIKLILPIPIIAFSVAGIAELAGYSNDAGLFGAILGCSIYCVTKHA